MEQRGGRELYDELGYILRAEEVANTIHKILSHANNLVAVAADSYAHPNGFRKVVLGSRTSGAKLRIHHWPDEKGVTSNVHNHRWSFASAVIAGAMHSTLLSEHPEGTELMRHTFVPGRAGDHYALALDGPRRVKITDEQTLPAGTGYYLDPEQLHQVRTEPNTLSVVLTGPAERLTTLVFRPRGLTPQALSLPRLEVEAVRDTLTIALYQLDHYKP